MPSSDEEFAERVATAAQELAGVHDREAIAELETHLLGVYPTMRVSQQSALASFDGLPVTWYFYRDG
jgi:hypothetical protein